MEMLKRGSLRLPTLSEHLGTLQRSVDDQDLLRAALAKRLHGEFCHLAGAENYNLRLSNLVVGSF
jgi:hypothetical protein